MSFENYTDSLFTAFLTNPKPADIIKKKQEIITGVLNFYNFAPESILYIGFNPAVLVESTPKIYVSKIGTSARAFLKNNGIKFTYIPEEDLHREKKSFDVTIALDEYFTFAKTDIDQKNIVQEICQVTKELVITTCKDYKNQEFKDREFSIPALIRNSSYNTIYLEFHNYDLNDRNSWLSEVFEIKGNSLNVFGPYNRRSMFFKQLAKFSSDFGSIGFKIHKNLMYKSLIKKNYEHVISFQFDNEY